MADLRAIGPFFKAPAEYFSEKIFLEELNVYALIV